MKNHRNCVISTGDQKWQNTIWETPSTCNCVWADSIGVSGKQHLFFAIILINSSFVCCMIRILYVVQRAIHNFKRQGNHAMKVKAFLKFDKSTNIKEQKSVSGWKLKRKDVYFKNNHCNFPRGRDQSHSGLLPQQGEEGGEGGDQLWGVVGAPLPPPPLLSPLHPHCFACSK